MTELRTLDRGSILIDADDGQMGRMQANAIHQAGYVPHIWSADENSPAAQVSNRRIPLEFKPELVDAVSTAALNASGVLCGFENVPAELVKRLGEQGVPVHSLPELLGVAQSRRAEKQRAADLNIPTVNWIYFDTLGTTGTPFDAINWQNMSYETIVKTDGGGYDGKGQWRFGDHDSLMDHDWEAEKAASFVIEEQVDLDFECSVMVVRNASGERQVSRAVRNVHKEGILHHSFWYPGAIPDTIEHQARRYAEWMAESFELVGLLCCEFFVTKNGQVLFNEMAPRPHNSFHGTMDACTFSQFDVYVQAIAGGELKEMEFLQPWVMVNLLGDAIQYRNYFQQANFAWHDYGKVEMKPGRKMGHATLVMTRGIEDPDHEINQAVSYAEERGS